MEWGSKFFKKDNTSSLLVIAGVWLYLLYVGLRIPFFFNLLIVPIAIGVGIVLWRRLGSKRFIYASSVIVLLVALSLTIGIQSTSSKTASGIVLKKWKDQLPNTSPEKYLVKVACEDGYMVAVLWRSQWKGLDVGEQVQLKYHTESILGMWDRHIVVDAIKAHTPYLSRSRGFSGTPLDKIFAFMTVVVGILPLSYLLYRDYIYTGNKGWRMTALDLLEERRKGRERKTRLKR